MLNLTLDQLIKISPFPEDVKQEALQKVPSMTPGQKFEFEQKCWDSLADIIDAKKRFKVEALIAKGAKEGLEDKIDVGAIEDEVIGELLKKIETVTTDDHMASIQQDLQQMQTPTTSIPNPQTYPAMQQHMMQPPQTPIPTSQPTPPSPVGEQPVQPITPPARES